MPLTLEVGRQPEVTERRVPAPPPGLLLDTRARWKEFWRSRYAALIDWHRDRQGLERLFELQDLKTRWLRSVQKHPLVEGSQGQPVANPLATKLTSLAAELRQLEERFGLSPRSAAQLGLTVSGLRKSLADLNRELDEGVSSEDMLFPERDTR